MVDHEGGVREEDDMVDHEGGLREEGDMVDHEGGLREEGDMVDHEGGMREEGDMVDHEGGVREEGDMVDHEGGVREEGGMVDHEGGVREGVISLQQPQTSFPPSPPGGCPHLVHILPDQAGVTFFTAGLYDIQTLSLSISAPQVAGTTDALVVTWGGRASDPVPLSSLALNGGE